MYYKSTDLPFSYEYNRATKAVTLSCDDFERLIEPYITVAAGPVTGAFNINMISPSDIRRLLNTGFLPVNGDVRSAIAFNAPVVEEK